MRGVIVDIKGEYAIALKKNGEFINIRNNGRYKVGYEYDVTPYSLMGMTARVASIAAVFILMLGIGMGAYSYSMPYSYVDVDINPSVEITVNVFDRIIGAEGLNDDGKKLLTEVGIKNRKLKEGINTILDSAVEQGYLKKDDENAIVVTIWSKNSGKAGHLEKNIQDTAAQKLESVSAEAEIMIEKVPVEEHEAARDYGITPGKMNLINKLLEEAPDLKVEDLKDKPVKDIMKSINEFKKDLKDKDKKGIKNSGNKDRSKKNSVDLSDKGIDPNKGNNRKDGNNGNSNSGNNGNSNSGKGKGLLMNPGKSNPGNKENGSTSKKNNGKNSQGSNEQKKNKKR